MRKGSDCLLKIHAKVQVFLFIGFFSPFGFFLFILWHGFVCLFLKQVYSDATPPWTEYLSYLLQDGRLLL